jgi:hypothetical protein
MKAIRVAAALALLAALSSSVFNPCGDAGRCAKFAGDVPNASQGEKATTPQARTQDANGNTAAGIVISRKTGARARVGAAYAARFQAYIDDLETNYGARVLFMGGNRPGRCSRASEHPCGKALDVCQHRRGVVDARCKLPARAALGKIAASHGLFEGGRWCNSDYGHVQVDVTLACGERRVRVARQ